MTHAAKILADSISPNGVRLTTFEITFPRIVLAEFNTHRVFSRNSASSRAIPVKKMLKRVKENPYVPSSWGKNQRGMQAEQDVDEKTAEVAKFDWLRGRDLMVQQVERLLELGIHKQLTNRLLEPWMWHTVIVTATEWSNFFNLRNNEMAHPDIQKPAALMQELYEAGTPKEVGHSNWHVPLIFDEDRQLLLQQFRHQHSVEELEQMLVKISCARCARVSYLTHDGKRDLHADLELYERLLQPGHMSPFEHAARPMTDDDLWKWDILNDKEAEAYDEEGLKDRREHLLANAFLGNFRGWVQHRKEIPGEADILSYRRAAE